MTPHSDDTIAAVSTAAGPGLRAIVRVTGPMTWAVVGKVFAASSASGGREPPGASLRGNEGGSEDHVTRPPPVSRQEGASLRAQEGDSVGQPLLPKDRTGGLTPLARRILLPGHVRLSGVPAPLPADLYFWPAPRTYTGQDLAELHTISSPPLVERLVADLLAAGARPAQPGEFTLRAFLAGKKDLTQAEAVLAVIEAGTDADLKQALAQLAGGVTRPLAALRDDLLNLLADVEAALDFADEDVTFVPRPDVLTRIAAGLAHLTNLRRQLDDRTVSGRPVRVAVVGHPNVGKSSLFNALAGTPAALVSPRAGTTRDYLTHQLDLGGVPAELIDTAGWQHADDTIAEQAQRLGREQAGRADVVLWCVPVGEAFAADDEAMLRGTGAELLRVRTKADLDPAPTADGSIPSSAVNPGGVDALRTALTERAAALARPALAPSQSRCRGHVVEGLAALRRAHEHALQDDPPELLALALREALEQVGELAGAVYTNDLLDRIFSRFCIGK